MRPNTTIPFTLETYFSQQVSIVELKQAIDAFNFQLPQTRLTLGQAASRLQTNGMIKLLEMNIPRYGDPIINLVSQTAIAWAHEKGLQLKPEIEANLNLLKFDWGTLSIYGQGKFDLTTGGPTLNGEFVGGIQIKWQGKVSRGQARQRRH
jgi:hypothetical protein